MIQRKTYDEIGIGYDDTRQADPYLAERMFHHLMGRDNGQYLDIGCGTGNYTTELHRRGLDIAGIDPSEEMLNKARIKAPQIKWINATSENIPMPDNSINGVLLSLTIHHWRDLHRGFEEIYRVLVKGGRLVIFTSYPEQTHAYWIRNYFPRMIEDSVKILPARNKLLEIFNEVGLTLQLEENYFVQEDLKDNFLQCGKHQPEKYFDENIRKGISSFSMLAYQEEIDNGLIKLSNDIKTGKFNSIKERHENSIGDYVFLLLEK